MRFGELWIIRWGDTLWRRGASSLRGGIGFLLLLTAVILLQMLLFLWSFHPRSRASWGRWNRQRFPPRLLQSQPLQRRGPRPLVEGHQQKTKTGIQSAWTSTLDRFCLQKDPTFLFGNISKDWNSDFIENPTVVGRTNHWRPERGPEILQTNKKRLSDELGKPVWDLLASKHRSEWSFVAFEPCNSFYNIKQKHCEV